MKKVPIFFLYIGPFSWRDVEYVSKDRANGGEKLQGEEFKFHSYGTVCVTTGIPCSSQEIWNQSLHFHTVAPGWEWVQVDALCRTNNYSGSAPWEVVPLCMETSQ